MHRTKTIKIVSFLAIIFLIGYFYSAEIRKNWAGLQNFKFVVNPGYLIASLSFYLLSYLLETYIWQVCVNKHLGRRELNFLQSIAVVNSSGLLKYVPGRIWTYTAQLLWLKKYGVSKSIVLYVNLICTLGGIIVSLYLGLFYLALYTNFMNRGTLALTAALLVLLNGAYILWNSAFMNKLIAWAGKLLKKEIQPLNETRSLVLYIQFIYLCSASLTGFGGYLLASGIGLPVPATAIFALLASMCLSWVVGYVSVISPGGLGIREGMMLVMLNNVVSVQTALIFPLVSRVMYLVAEALLGLAALLLGVKYDVFSSEEKMSKRSG